MRACATMCVVRDGGAQCARHHRGAAEGGAPDAWARDARAHRRLPRVLRGLDPDGHKGARAHSS